MRGGAERCAEARRVAMERGGCCPRLNEGERAPGREGIAPRLSVRTGYCRPLRPVRADCVQVRPHARTLITLSGRLIDDGLMVIDPSILRLHLRANDVGARMI